MTSRRIWLATLIALSAGCARDVPPADAPADSIHIAAIDARVAADCYRSPTSVLLGPATAAGQNADGPGWIAIEATSADSGWAVLIDSASKQFAARWIRVAPDSVAFTAADDFLRVEMRLRLAKEALDGRAEARSDAALERDQSGQMTELVRAWTLEATRTTCDSIPAAPAM